MFLLFYLLHLLSRFLFEIDENLHAGFAMSIDKLIGVIVFLEGEAVAYEWLEALREVCSRELAYLDGLHQRTDGNFYTCYLETYLIAFEEYDDAYKFIDAHRETSMKVLIDFEQKPGEKM